jgi:predicted nucleic acid-binding protein
VPVAVVDASAILAILFGEPDASRVVERLGARDLAAPSLLPYEIMNAAATKVRRGEVTRDAADIVVSAFANVRIALHEPAASDLFRLAVETRLTAYDAAYLWLARSLSADLVTLDGKLAGAWSRLRR